MNVGETGMNSWDLWLFTKREFTEQGNNDVKWANSSLSRSTSKGINGGITWDCSLSNLLWWGMSLPMARVWNWMSFKIFPTHSIPCFYKASRSLPNSQEELRGGFSSGEESLVVRLSQFVAKETAKVGQDPWNWKFEGKGVRESVQAKI